MEARLGRLLTTAWGCLEKVRTVVVSSDAAETPEDARWRVIAVFLPRRDVEACAPGNNGAVA